MTAYTGHIDGRPVLVTTHADGTAELAFKDADPWGRWSAPVWLTARPVASVSPYGGDVPRQRSGGAA